MLALPLLSCFCECPPLNSPEMIPKFTVLTLALNGRVRCKKVLSFIPHGAKQGKYGKYGSQGLGAEERP